MTGEGRGPKRLFPFPSFKSYCFASYDQIRANVLSCLERGLPEVKRCYPHDGTLCIAGGGPSLAKTYRDMKGKIATVNRAGDWLISQGVIPYACSLLDPHPILAESFTPHPGVVYFVASMCDPAVFDKLKGYTVFVWHASSGKEGRDLLEEILDEKGKTESLVIGGGCTVGLRWINLGYMLGYRRFHIHGLDSSWSPDGKHHAYNHPQNDGLKTFVFNGHHVTMGMLTQMTDFFAVMERFKRPDIEPCEFEVFGEGLLPDEWRARNKE